jgi:type VI secretion system protein ImpH
MPPAQRRNAIGVIEQLLREPQQFGFFQAVRLLDRWMAASSPDGQGLSKLNFRNSLSLSFPASEIEALLVHRSRSSDGGELPQPDGEAAEVASTPSALGLMLDAIEPDALPRHAAQIDRIDMTPAFMGLLGVSGTLPLFYTEMLAQRELYQKDYAARAFMDVFSHRSVSLFYQAWRKHRLPIQYEADRQNKFLPLVLSLAGVGQKGLRNRLGGEQGAVADESLAYFAGALQQRTLSVKQLHQVLQHYLGVPVRIDQFVGRWYQLPEAGRFYLGQMQRQGGAMGSLNGVLGKSTMLGERVWQRDLRMRVSLGPLNHAKFRRFLPGGKGALALKELLTMLSGVSLEYEINLQLQREDIHGCTLDSNRPATAARLGWDTFLQTKPANEDRVDVSYDIHAAA